MSDFAFPFSTCESVNEHGLQPYSATVNIATTMILIVCIFISKKIPVKIALASFATFEAFHAFSHLKHIPGTLQTNIVHALGYFMSFATLYAILKLGKTSMPPISIFILSGIIAIDVYVWIYVRGIYTIFTGLLVFAAVVVLNYAILPSVLKRALPYLLIGLLVIFVLFINEHCNCERMMNVKVFPYHIAIEITGLVLFTALAATLLLI